MKHDAKPRAFIEEIPYIEDHVHVFERFLSDSMPFLLDSAMELGKYGRYTMMGGNPRIALRSKSGVTEIIERGISSLRVDNPLNIIEEVINKFGAIANDPDQNVLPFTGGAVGYFGYDLNRQIERIPKKALDDQLLPDICLGFYDEAIVVDHKDRRAYAMHYTPHDTISSRRLGARRIKFLVGRVKQATLSRPNMLSSHFRRNAKLECENVELASNFSKENYMRAICSAQDRIYKGDIFQVNLAQRFSFNIASDHFALYRKLRKLNPAPFAAFLSCGGFSILSSSPERFLYINDRFVETRPIKGTRPRSADPAKDYKSKIDLLASEKDSAEHIMIVDVERNDLGRVCEHGSVRVPDLMVVESYESVHHLVSTVTGILRPDKSAIDLLRASFPGGSITGAPKIRAMEIIEELEPHRRNVYCGAIGYISTNGTMDTNIAIRTITAMGNKGYLQVGGGIVADSNPKDEYEETLHKGRTMFEAVGGNGGIVI